MLGGRLNLTAGYNYNKTKIRKRAGCARRRLRRFPAWSCSGGRMAAPHRGQPRNKINLSAPTATATGSALTLRTTRYGKAARRPALPDQRSRRTIELAAKWITDLELRCKPFGERLEFALGANNLFDVYPTEHAARTAVDPVRGAVNLPVDQLFTPIQRLLAVRLQRPLPLRAGRRRIF